VSDDPGYPVGAVIVTEHATEMTSGEMRVRCADPAVQRVYPLAQWIKDQQQERKVYRRRVIVVEDWVEVPKP
jgi:hypothetical protein